MNRLWWSIGLPVETPGTRKKIWTEILDRCGKLLYGEDKCHKRHLKIPIGRTKPVDHPKRVTVLKALKVLTQKVTRTLRNLNLKLKEHS